MPIFEISMPLNFTKNNQSYIDAVNSQPMQELFRNRDTFLREKRLEAFFSGAGHRVRGSQDVMAMISNYLI
jgi:hypothetical protein